MSSDNFYEDIKRAERIERTINENIKMRSEQVAKGQPTGGTDYKIRNNLDSLSDSIRQLEKMVHLFDSDPDEYRLTNRECDKRRNLVKDLKKKKDVLALKVNDIITDKGALFGVNNATAEDERLLGEDGEYGETREKTNRQILDKQKDMLQQQDRQLDEIRGIVGVIKQDN